MLDDCVHNQDALVIFLEKVYCRLSSDTFDLVDDVIESVHSVTHASEDVKKRYCCTSQYTAVNCSACF